jgi:hypothetical protein
MTKIVVHRDGFDDPGDRFGAEGGDPSRHDVCVLKTLSGIVER